MLAAAALASVISLASGSRATMVWSERTEARRIDDGTNQSYEIELLPGTRLQLEDGTNWIYALQYSTRIIFNGLERVPREGFDPLVPDTLHIGAASVTWRPTRTAAIELREDAQFGDLNFTSIYSNPTAPSATAPAQPNAPPDSLQRVPLGQKITYLSSTTLLTTRVAPSRRWGLTTSVGYVASGGVESGAQIYLPFQKGPKFEESYAYALSRRASFVGNLSAQRSEFQNGFRGDVILESQGLGLKGRYWNASASIGGALLRRRETADAATSTVPSPVAEASFGASYGKRLKHADGRLTARLGPVIQVNGSVDQRLQGFLDLSGLWDPVGIRLHGGVAQSLPYDDPLSVFLLEGSGTLLYNISRKTTIEGGYRIVYQLLYSDIELEKPVQVIFVAFNTTLPVLRL